MVDNIFYEIGIGALSSLSVSALASILGGFLGILLGLISALSDSWVIRRCLVALREATWSISGFFLALMVTLIFNGGEWTIAFVLVIFQWPVYAEIIDWHARNLLKEDYVKSQVALGATKLWIFKKTLIPNAITIMFKLFPARWAEAWTVELSLNYLGLGFPPDVPSLGRELFFTIERNATGGYGDIATIFIVLTLGFSFGILLRVGGIEDEW